MFTRSVNSALKAFTNRRLKAVKESLRLVYSCPTGRVGRGEGLPHNLDLDSSPLNPERVVGTYQKLMISTNFISQSKPGELASENCIKGIMKVGVRVEEHNFFCTLPSLTRLTDLNELYT